MVLKKRKDGKDFDGNSGGDDDDGEEKVVDDGDDDYNETE
jgi:hypothetical protein